MVLKWRQYATKVGDDEIRGLGQPDSSRNILEELDAVGKSVLPRSLARDANDVRRLDGVDTARPETACQQSANAGARADIEHHGIRFQQLLHRSDVAVHSDIVRDHASVTVDAIHSWESGAWLQLDSQSRPQSGRRALRGVTDRREGLHGASEPS